MSANKSFACPDRDFTSPERDHRSADVEVVNATPGAHVSGDNTLNLNGPTEEGFEATKGIHTTAPTHVNRVFDAPSNTPDRGPSSVTRSDDSLHHSSLTSYDLVSTRPHASTLPVNPNASDPPQSPPSSVLFTFIPLRMSALTLPIWFEAPSVRTEGSPYVAGSAILVSPAFTLTSTLPHSPTSLPLQPLEPYPDLTFRRSECPVQTSLAGSD